MLQWFCVALRVNLLENTRKGLAMITVVKAAKKRMLALNDRRCVIGESHPRAVLTDEEVDLMLALRDEGKSLAWLGEKFGVHKGTAAKICSGQRRGQVAVDFVPPGGRRARGR